MSAITTHVLDTSRGCPAGAVPLLLELRDAAGTFQTVGRGATDADGRCRTLLPAGVPLRPGTYRLTFDTAFYFSAAGTEAFFPTVPIVFDVKDAAQHFHVPLLLSPFGFSTYRGT